MPKRTIGDLISQVQVMLCDGDAVHWSENELITYLNEALCEIAGLRPDAFVKMVTLELEPGEQQQLPKPYIDLVKVEENLDKNGKPKDGSISKTTSTAGDRLGAKYRCDPDGVGAKYEGITGYKITAQSHGYFTVSPPVPEGEKAYVNAMVYVPPPHFHADDLGDENCVLPCIYDAQIIDWIMKRAYEKDVESQWARDRAAYHYSLFRTGMDADYRSASRLRSGYMLGMKGDGVETTGWRNEIRGIFGS